MNNLYILNVLEQFEVVPVFSIFGIVLTNVAVIILLVFTIIILFILRNPIKKNFKQIINSRQNFLLAWNSYVNMAKIFAAIGYTCCTIVRVYNYIRKSWKLFFSVHLVFSHKIINQFIYIACKTAFLTTFLWISFLVWSNIVNLEDFYLCYKDICEVFSAKPFPKSSQPEILYPDEPQKIRSQAEINKDGGNFVYFLTVVIILSIICSGK